jgi:hypothetical protein
MLSLDRDANVSAQRREGVEYIAVTGDERRSVLGRGGGL